MEPRGQLWFELERVCRDFRDCSGLEAEDALKVLVVVLRNMLAEQEVELVKLTSARTGEATGG